MLFRSIPWNGRAYQMGDFEKSNAINQALSAGHACLYGLSHAVIVALGCSPGLGFVHVGGDLSFVYDFADLYKAEFMIPIVFEATAENPPDLPAYVRRKVRDVMSHNHLLERMVRDLHYLLSEKEEEVVEEEAIYLWDNREGMVRHGISYKAED